MTFREALQAEINLQGLSVAQIAKDSSVSKGAIYNILNGTTEDARIRPATRKALAAACNREVRPEGDGVLFVEPGAETPVETADTQVSEQVVLSWRSDRPFLADDHVSAGFDWLHALEADGTLGGLRIVDRVYQNRAEFLSLIVSNRCDETIESVRLGFTVSYGKQSLSHDFTSFHAETCLPGEALEVTAFVCVGPPFTLSLTRAELALNSGATTHAQLPTPFSFDGGSVD